MQKFIVIELSLYWRWSCGFKIQKIWDDS